MNKAKDHSKRIDNFTLMAFYSVLCKVTRTSTFICAELPGTRLKYNKALWTASKLCKIFVDDFLGNYKHISIFLGKCIDISKENTYSSNINR